MLLEIERRNDVRPDGGRREIDGKFTGFGDERRIVFMRFGTGRIEDQIDLIHEVLPGEQTFDAVIDRDDVVLASAREAVALGVDPDEGDHLEIRIAKNLEHQIRSDVARTDDRDIECHVLCLPYDLNEPDRNGAEDTEIGSRDVSARHRDHRAERARHDHIACL